MEQESLQLGRKEQDKLIQSVTMMNQVAKRLKQVAELPSEKATDNHPLTKVEFPDEGEVFTFMEGYDHPYRGYPYYEFVDKIDLVKKLSRNIQSGFYHGLKNTWFRYLLIPLIPILGKQLFWAFTYSFHRLIDRFQMRTNRYSQFVGELYRAASVGWSDETPKDAELRKMLRDIECMILEFDNAYRFRAQDLIPEINKEALSTTPLRELNRLLDIWIERENGEDIKNSWRLLKLFVSYYLRFDRKLRRTIVRILLELDQAKCALTVEDKYFSIPRTDYKFKFITTPTKEDLALIAKVKIQKEFDAAKTEIQRKSTIEHGILTKLHNKEVEALPAAKSSIDELENRKKLLQEKGTVAVYQIQRQISEEIAKSEVELLTTDQKELLKKHNNEIQQLDQKFETQLLEAEQNYLEQKAKI